MIPLSAYSRRALVATAGLLAAAPVAEAKKKKGKKKKRPASPLAFAAVRVSDLTFFGSPEFSCTVDGAWRYPAESAVGTFGTDVEATYGTDSQVRAQIAGAVQEFVSTELEVRGHDVPADRIAVTLL